MNDLVETLHQQPCCGLVVIYRTGLNRIETECTVSPTGPSVETLIRGLYGDKRDSEYSLTLFESPCSAKHLMEAFLREPIVAEYVYRTIYIGCCDDPALLEQGPSQPPLGILRPLPIANEDRECSAAVQWRWFEDPHSYRSALEEVYKEVAPWA